MIKAERNLDLFWSKYDASWKRLTAKSADATIGHHIPSHRGQKIASTVPWVEPIKEQKPASEAKEPKQSMNMRQASNRA
jgi:hypothetical protein